MEFPAEAVTRHVGAVDEASDEMSRARAAAGEVAMDSQAYGQLCQFLPALLSPLFGSATGVMNDAMDALGETSSKLRATATGMNATDAASARQVNSAATPHLDLPL
ncbi:type VII secretion target [Actinoplanes sp. M2I2]|uniref:type VII secretion target n=1 Tax=Actinoplanes sp. M2I2 TaxID=1734444 RepID=UPI00202018F2|nr:type VII secretion target [Actinoplanes sp. M2I2]